MNSNSIYTRKTFGLDKTVWLVMLAAIIIPSGLLSYTLISKKDCVPVKFTFSSFSTHAGNIFRTDETISFNASSKDITWDFGDHSGNAYGQYFEHKFLSQGDYYVKAKSDLGCDTIQKIVIVKPKQDSIIEITGPDNTVTGSTVYFKYPVKANHYEWSVTDHTGFVIQKTPTAKFIFPVKGTFTIQVNLDNDPTKRATKVIVS